MSWQVAQGTQVHFDGVTYAGGETLPELDDSTTAAQLAELDRAKVSGWLVEVEQPTVKKPRASR